ncbi:N-acetylmuramoyl-L-alanine amidase [Oricola sp.]|uniref:N-acetylmuramoyl-L-alanine amidase n=1 Tax=Oricola sp. TaxID=1979950 RepID=UPI003BA9429B
MNASLFDPDYADAVLRASPSFDERRDGKAADILLLHYTGLRDGASAEDWLCDPQSSVSCHYIVHEDGRVVQMVAEAARAWHAGVSVWQGETDINSHSIGIEIVNGGHDHGMPDFPEKQIDAVIALARDIVGRNAIAPARVLAHSDVAPGRKADPGEKFPWARFAAAGIGHWVEPAPLGGGRYLTMGEAGQPVEALQSMLALYGYGIEVNGVFNGATATVVTAFQRHFRPQRVDGVADVSTIDTLHRLLAALPQFRKGQNSAAG